MHSDAFRSTSKDQGSKNQWFKPKTSLYRELCVKVPLSKPKGEWGKNEKVFSKWRERNFGGTRLTNVISGDTSTPASHADDQLLRENTCWSFLQGYGRQSHKLPWEAANKDLKHATAINPASALSTLTSDEGTIHRVTLNAGKQKCHLLFFIIYIINGLYTTAIVSTVYYLKKNKVCNTNPSHSHDKKIDKWLLWNCLESVKIVEAVKKDVLGRKQEPTSISVLLRLDFLRLSEEPS